MAETIYTINTGNGVFRTTKTEVVERYTSIATVTAQINGT